MTTALQVITRSLRLLGVYASGESPTGAEAADALSVFNSMLQGLGVESLNIFAQTTQTIAFPAGTQSRTIGPTGNIVMPRPTAMLNSTYLLVGGVSRPLAVLTPWEWSDITLKSLNGYPTGIYYESNEPNAKITLYPAPSMDVSVVFNSAQRLGKASGDILLTDILSLPDGYDRMLAYMLAMDLAPEYGKEVSKDIRLAGTHAKRVLKRANLQVPYLTMPNGIPGGYTGWIFGTIITGEGSEDVLVPIP